MFEMTETMTREERLAQRRQRDRERRRQKRLEEARVACETASVSYPAGWRWKRAEVLDRAHGMTLVGAEYCYDYSSRAGSWWTGASYLTGTDDGGPWAVRVPRTLWRVAEALEYIVPAAVRKAQAECRWAGRQGDVWLVELLRGDNNLRDLPRSHRFYNGGRGMRVLLHREHGPLRVPPHVHAVRAYTQIGVHGDVD